MKGGLMWLVGLLGLGGLAIFIALFPPALAVFKALLETKAGRIVLAIGGAILTGVIIYAKANHDATKRVVTEVKNRQIKSKEKINVEEVGARAAGDAAAERVRDAAARFANRRDD